MKRTLTTLLILGVLVVGAPGEGGPAAHPQVGNGGVW